MNQEDFMTGLPSEIIINILSRLPVRSIISCKCVCKSWIHLLSSHDFSKSHLSRSKPGLVVYLDEAQSKLIKIFELEDSLDNLESHELRYNSVTKLDVKQVAPSHGPIEMEGSANGLLFLREISAPPRAHHICNPITRECISLPIPDEHAYYYPSIVTYGFGVSKISDQHKVVRIFHDCIRHGAHTLLNIPKSVCQVYTLRTGSWRTIAPGAPLEYDCRSIGAFVNGNLHWMVADLEGSIWISCFNLENEVFSTFSPPPGLPERRRLHGALVASGDCLCLCDNSSHGEIVIWLMKEYGVEKSWTKEFVIGKTGDFRGECYEIVYPIKAFEDGDVLMAMQDLYLFYYSNKSGTISEIDILEPAPSCFPALAFTPSFLSLKSVAMEIAKSF